MMSEEEKINNENDKSEVEAGEEIESDAETQIDESPDEDSSAESSNDGAEQDDDNQKESDEEAVTATEEVPTSSVTKSSRKKRTPEEKAERRARRKRKRIAARSEERKPIVRLPKPQKPRAARKERVGVVVSDAMDQTITVRVERSFPHSRYGKVVRRSTKFVVHDAENTAGIGDRVRIVETRPLSKTKRWRLAEILEVSR